MNTFRRAVESKDLALISAILAPDIIFNSPAMVKPYHGRDQVMALMRALVQTFEDFIYTDELVADDETQSRALIFGATIAGKRVQGVDLVRYNEEGFITDLTVMVRPLPAAMTLARMVGKLMEAAA
jgi:hypothetical protein